VDRTCPPQECAELGALDVDRVEGTHAGESHSSRSKIRLKCQDPQICLRLSNLEAMFILCELEGRPLRFDAHGRTTVNGCRIGTRPTAMP